MTPYFVTGIGTGVGKTLVSAILAESLHADYWKPVQSGYEQGTDTGWVESMISNDRSKVHPEVYKFKAPVSPNIAAREEEIEISTEKILAQFAAMRSNASRMIIEGAGGLLVPLNDFEFVADLVRVLNAKVILVSRNYLGSINHSLMTAHICRQKNLRVMGWVFTDSYLNYEEDIVRWSGYPRIASIPRLVSIDKEAIAEVGLQLKEDFLRVL
jgi:dethiobiotin synthetase